MNIDTSLDPKRVPLDRRRDIVSRFCHDGRTMVYSAGVKTPEELSFAIRWLMEHYTYKRSKGNNGQVSHTGACNAVEAAQAAIDSFTAETAEPNGIAIDVEYPTPVEPVHPPISPLSRGSISNPYSLL